MSASPIARQVTQSQNIPSKRVVIHDPNQLPVDYSSTPGGTLYSTTPGGTRIVYERAFLMNLRNSPISLTPPKNMPSFPTDLLKNASTIIATNGTAGKQSTKDITIIEETSEQFEMDM
ncbi:eukaryotic translation initiation factor 4E-binding protein 1 [Chelonus insularis]|uniref:eukaryotic translation initiation factor 4E-binding protein 1 n=1 Tax=Chelonus insularis TaxID=460826 RepID=UPI00158E752E|nr:eukaryotic translation initiation factor 4E-binding protein 1 [Chelonus insularis]XP_034934658.1 eukaryotic translation initiation factor 4E-binding protein 1 [Chelonus insularis]